MCSALVFSVFLYCSADFADVNATPFGVDAFVELVGHGAPSQQFALAPQKGHSHRE